MMILVKKYKLSFVLIHSFIGIVDEFYQLFVPDLDGNAFGFVEAFLLRGPWLRLIFKISLF